MPAILRKPEALPLFGTFPCAVQDVGRRVRILDDQAYRVNAMTSIRNSCRLRLLQLVVGGLLAAFAALPALAHHGWAWSEDGNSELSGVIVASKLGNPHGELTLDVGGANWLVEVGQPWRNQRAGLRDEMLVKGVKLTVTGHRAADSKKKLFKAERVLIGDQKFDLYPDRN